MLFSKKTSAVGITLFNSAAKEKETFVPLCAGKVKMYTCGPTVYDYVHIGNLRSFVFSDIVRRTFEYALYDVRQVINITDFGHLVDDADNTEDKMVLALRREGREYTMEAMHDVATTYIKAFKNDLREMNVKAPHVMPRASEHVEGQIAYVQTLLDKGFAYGAPDGVYFNTEQFPRYGVLGGSASPEHSRIAARDGKKNTRDFALWKFSERLGWDAPWGKGFPGWHIECTAMSTRYLGKSFDIHTGGIDLKTTHHNNEIAQAESANNKPYARYWLHNEFIDVDNIKISKSLGNIITLTQLVDRGISPLAYRYWLLGGHYRQKMNFTWEAVGAAQTALHRAWRIFAELKTKKEDIDGNGTSGKKTKNNKKECASYMARFQNALYDDFNTPQAIAVLWELLKDESVATREKKEMILRMDEVLGVGFGSSASRIEKKKVSVVEALDIPEHIQRLASERDGARHAGDFPRADALRAEIEKHGYTIQDSPAGSVVNRP